MLTQGIETKRAHGSSELSRSTAWNLLTTCPAKVKHDRENPSPATPTIIGDAFHTATLEPLCLNRFAKHISGKGPLSTYKEAFAEMQAEEPQVKWLNLIIRWCDMASSALDHPSKVAQWKRM